MARRKVYVVKSGSLHPTKGEYWFTRYYFSSKKSALKETKQILEINRAKDIVRDDRTIEVSPEMLEFVDYVGEEGRYKGRIIVEWFELRP